MCLFVHFCLFAWKCVCTRSIWAGAQWTLETTELTSRPENSRLTIPIWIISLNRSAWHRWVLQPLTCQCRYPPLLWKASASRCWGGSDRNTSGGARFHAPRKSVNTTSACIIRRRFHWWWMYNVRYLTGLCVSEHDPGAPLKRLKTRKGGKLVFLRASNSRKQIRGSLVSYVLNKQRSH